VRRARPREHARQRGRRRHPREARRRDGPRTPRGECRGGRRAASGALAAATRRERPDLVRAV
jgi:hypothetical protein